jgi:hypothetical protein
VLTQRVLLAGWLARPPRRGSDSKSVNTHAPRQTTWDVSSNMHGHELISTHSKNFEVSGCDLWATADLFGSGSATADGTCSLRTTRQMNRAPPVRICLIPVRQGKRCVLLRQKTPDQRDRGNQSDRRPFALFCVALWKTGYGGGFASYGKETRLFDFAPFI